MNSLESLVLSWLLNSIWQVPLVCAAAWIGARLIRPAGPAAEHKVWVGALCCEVLLPFLSILPLDDLYFHLPWNAHRTLIPGGSVSIVMSSGTASAGLRLPPALLWATVCAYLAITCYFILRFVWQFARVSRLARHGRPVELGAGAASSCSKWMRRFGLSQVKVAVSDALFAPVTIGWWRPSVLLPDGIVSRLRPDDFDIAIAHEFAHIRRNDFAKNLLYEFVTLPLTYHPALWFTRQRLVETREMACDEMAAGVSGNRAYAQSLLRLASLLLQGHSVRIPHAIGVFDANTFERRLMRITEDRREVGRTRRYGSLAACVALGVVTATSALALHVAVDSPGTADKHASKSIPREIPAREMQNRLVNKVNPVYPPDAKKARIQGAVVLYAVIGKTGDVENVKVLSGPPELQQSALDAVRQWRYEPVLWHGNPIEVETKITVRYTLAK